MAHLPIGLLKESAVTLRATVEHDESLNELKKSIEKIGLLNPIIVTRRLNKETNSEYFLIVDGIRRLVVCEKLNMALIPCHIVNISDQQILEVQIICSSQHVPVSNAQYALALKKILQIKPEMYMDDLCKKIGKDPDWVSKMLDFGRKLCGVAHNLVCSNGISVANAIGLRNVSTADQPRFIEDCKSKPAEVMIPKMLKFVKAKKGK